MCRLLLGTRMEPAPHDAVDDAIAACELLNHFMHKDWLWSCLLTGRVPSSEGVATRMLATAKQAALYERYKALVMQEVEELRETTGEKDGVFRIGCVTTYYKSGTRRIARIPKNFDIPDHWYVTENTSRKNISFSRREA